MGGNISRIVFIVLSEEDWSKHLITRITVNPRVKQKGWVRKCSGRSSDNNKGSVRVVMSYWKLTTSQKIVRQ